MLVIENTPRLRQYSAPNATYTRNFLPTRHSFSPFRNTLRRKNAKRRKQSHHRRRLSFLAPMNRHNMHACRWPIFAARPIARGAPARRPLQMPPAAHHHFIESWAMDIFDARRRSPLRSRRHADAIIIHTAINFSHLPTLMLALLSCRFITLSRRF